MKLVYRIKLYDNLYKSKNLKIAATEVPPINFD